MDNTEVLFAVSTAISPDTIPAYAGTESTYTYKVNVAVSTTENLTVQVSSDVYALASDLEDHEEEEVASAAGAHGLRYYNDILAVFNGSAWDEIKTGGGGSTLRVFTEDSSLMGGSVSITGDGETVTGTLSNTGEATFEGFMMTGTITVTVTKGAATGTETATIPYYGSYEVEVATGTKYTLNITTTESTLYGKTVTATYGGDSKTATISNSGTATINIFGYTGAVVVTATDGTYTATTNVTITSGTTTYTVPLSFVSVYGASWDGTSTTSWSRTDDAAGFTDPVPYKAGATSYGSPFDTLMPWSGMVKSTDAEAGTVVAIPKFWYKITQSGSGIKIQIADGEKDGFSVSPAHMDRGDGAGERDTVYVGRYHCATSTYKSTTGVKPQVNITRSAARTSIHNLGTKVWQMDFATRFTLWLLYIVEFADWNSQAKIGYGCGDNSATGNMGYTDSMPYHTGTTQADRTTYGLGTQYRNIEGLWDNVRDWCDGVYYDANGMNIILNPNNFSDTTGGTSIGTPSSGYPSKFEVKNVAGTYQTFIPTEASGSDSTYSCDNWSFNASTPCLVVGGNYYQNLVFGMFYIGFSAATGSSADIGSRLLKLP